MQNESDYDIIIIGSGMGALATGSILARTRGARVLILERNFKAGGFTHTFKRDSFEWDVGLHYVGQMDPGDFTRRVFDYVTGSSVTWNDMPDPFEKFCYPDFTFSVHRGAERYRRELIERFPKDAAAIDAYFRDLARARRWMSAAGMGATMPAPLRLAMGLYRRWAARDLQGTTKEVLSRLTDNRRLIATLTSQWGDYGLPPGRSSFLVHALIAGHYFNGGKYPVGGAGKIAAGARVPVETAGGAILLNHRVEKILVEDGRAAGVRVRINHKKREDEIKEFRAPIVISNAGAFTTYLELLPEEHPAPFQSELRELRDREPVPTTLCLYLGFKDDPRSLGFQGENHWIYRGYDHDAATNAGLLEADGEPDGLYLSFPALKDPAAKTFTADVLTFLDYDLFSRWREAPWKNRGDEYAALKERIAANILRFLDRRYPGFSDLVEYAEVSTPISNEFFTGHHRGMIYGLPALPGRFDPKQSPWADSRTHLPGLYLTGADAGSLGIVGALMGGFKTALTLMSGREKMRFFRSLPS